MAPVSTPRPAVLRRGERHRLGVGTGYTQDTCIAYTATMSGVHRVILGADGSAGEVFNYVLTIH